MKNSFSESYKASGVDVTAGYKSVELFKKKVSSTAIKGVMSSVGGFGGLFDLSGYAKEPVLVSGTDGVGTKLKIAFIMDKHDTIGIDCVAMCVNDIVCSGAKPLFFLDYIAQSKVVPEKVAAIVSGVADGCLESGCTLLGGETAEMPGFYAENEYDIAGFAVGVVDKSAIIDGSSITEGDVLIGLYSSGLHSNGFSLVRKVFEADTKPEKMLEFVPELGKRLGDELLTPTKLYYKDISALTGAVRVKGIANITGGGFFENIPRMFPENISAKISKKSYEVPAVFKLLQSRGDIPERDMYNTFNMGIGMVVCVDEKDATAAIKVVGANGVVLGKTVSGTDGVILED